MITNKNIDLKAEDLEDELWNFVSSSIGQPNRWFVFETVWQGTRNSFLFVFNFNNNPIYEY